MGILGEDIVDTMMKDLTVISNRLDDIIAERDKYKKALEEIRKDAYNMVEWGEQIGRLENILRVSEQALKEEK